MAVSSIYTTVHVCEDINKQFNILELLIASGYIPAGPLSVVGVVTPDANGNYVPLPTPLVTMVGSDGIEITAANVANYNGEFPVFTLTIDLGNDNEIYLEVQVIIDPVNDAPAGEDKSIDLVDGSPYILSASDFGFSDVVENNGFQSVLINSLPFKGTLLLDGLAVAAGTDVSVADIQAGKLSFVPDANSSGNVEFGFQVRDDGGTAGCNASDLDLTPNRITFNVPYASLGDFVFNDDNRNGVQDATETGVAGVTVTLRGAGADGLFGTADDTTTVKVTDSNGKYLFDQLDAGKYQADFSGIASDKAFTAQDQGSNDTQDSDVNATGNSGVYTLVAGQTNTTLDAGLVTNLGSIGDYAFFDKNRNGVQDAGDTPFTNIKVTLLGAGADGQFGTADDTTATQFTDVVGYYQFNNLQAGKYQVEFTNPSTVQLSFTTANAGADDTKDSDIDAATGLSQVIDLAAGEVNTTIDGGFVLNPATVGDFVFYDKNGNGVQDSGEAGVANVTVTLVGAGSNDYIGSGNNTVVTTTTDSNGFYQFTGLERLTDYQIAFSALPSGYTFTTANSGSDDSLDSDAGIDGKTDIFTVQPAEVNNTFDAGLVAKKGSIGDFVFIDKNGNGVQDAGDTAVSGATVTLQGAGVDGVFGNGDDTTTVTTTDANGKYVFNNVAGDQDYQVTFGNTPAGYSFTTQGAGGNTALDSDANASGVTNVFHLNAGETRTDIDAGLVEPKGAIGDLVFYDTNRDGLQDANDFGLSGMTVTLAGAGQDGVFGTADDISTTTTTDADGKYLFDGLSAGKYQVSFSKSPYEAIADYTLIRAGTDGTIDSDADANGLTQEVTLGIGEINTTLDGGLVLKQASLGDFVFLDKNGNGLQDSDEAGVAGVSVALTGAGIDGVFGTADDISANTTTDSTGKYAFTGLESNQSYQVQFGNLPAGYEFTTTGVGSDNAVDSDAGASGLTQTYVLSPDENLTTVDAGIVAKKGAIGDFVFIDKNGNGVQDAGDTAVSGATVTLQGAGVDGVFGNGDDTTTVTTTDANGKYVFNNVAGDQDYQVTFGNTPAGYSFTTQGAGGNTALDSDANTSGVTNVFRLNAGETRTDIDAGLVAPKGTIGDTVFFDRNEDGLQQATESGVGGVTVTLTSAGADGVLGTGDDTSTVTTTDANGKYLFTDLTAGKYQVGYSNIPSIANYTLNNVGSDTAIDSNANPATGLTEVINLAEGQVDLTIDGGLILKHGAIGDFVFKDTNGNGIQDATEAGVAGVTVKLVSNGFDGILGTADDVNLTTTTDTNGKYLFNNLSTDQVYQVSFSGIPAGYEFTQAGAGGNAALDSNADATGAAAPIYLAPGETNSTIDAGLVAGAACLGDQVFFDNNNNGIQDAGDTGVAGVLVTLTGAGFDGVFGTSDDTTNTQTTDANGHYSFHNLAGEQDYKVQFSNTPAGYDFVSANVGGDDNIDSDVNASGATGVIRLDAAEDDYTIDAGLVARLGSIGDRVWHDVNGNGLQDGTEVGVDGITVKLTGAGADGTLGTADDVVTTTTTSGGGQYLFGGLKAGAYTVAFSGITAAQAFTTKDAGGNTNEATDSDVDATGKTGVINLAAGQNNRDVDAGIYNVSKPNACVGDRVWFDDNKNGLQDSCEAGVAGVTVKLIGAGVDGVFGSADDITKTTTTDSCGFYKFTGLYSGQHYQIQFGTKTGYGFTTQDVGSNDHIDSDAAKTTGLTRVFTLADGECNTSFDAGLVCRLNASVGNRVWNDCNNNGVQDTGEGGLACVSVKLIGSGLDGVWGNADDVCLTTTTDANGYYKFSGLTGDQQYQLQFGTLNGYSRSAQDVGTDNAKDSDANVSTGLTQTFTLADGENNTSFDAGLYCKPTASVGDRVWLDCNGNGIQDAGDAGVACVTVKLTGAGMDGVFGTADDISKTTTTDACGFYKFSGLIGDQQYKLQFTAPAGYLFTGQDKGTNDTLDSDVNSAGLTNAFTLAAGQNKTDIDAGLVKQVTACIVGATSVYEGCSANYQVKLSGAVSTDTWLTVAAIDGTAKRTGVDASIQNLTGINAQTKDYALIGTDCKIDADGVISVKVAAGQTSSAVFSLSAWKENVSVDFFTYLTGGYKESAWENLKLNLSNSTNALVTIGSSDLNVSIGDTTIYALSSPIALDMDGNGIQTTALIDSKGTFDLLGNGKAVNSGWLSSGDAFLAIDNNSNGKIDSVSELFGGNKGDGFAKLSSFDTNGDGLVDAKDADFGKLLVWQDLNGDHATDAGELRTLGEAGIASLNTGFTDGAIDQLGNILGETSLATRTDGTQIVTTDVYFNTDVDGASLPELSSLLSSTNALLDQAFGAAPAAAPAAPAANDAMVTADAETLRQLAALLEQHAVAA